VPVADLLADLPAPRRENSVNAMIAVVQKRPGINSHDLAHEMNVDRSYVNMLAGRLAQGLR
jgi:hypothetical protein